MNLETIKKAAKDPDKENLKDDEKNIIYTTSQIHEDKIIEMLYDKDARKTSFAVWNDGDCTEVDKYPVGDIIYKPYPITKNIILTGTVSLPSTLGEYKDTAELVQNVQTFIRKYLTISEEFEPIAIQYILFTWIYDDFNELPYLRALGDYGSGKSRFLQVIGGLCYKKISGGGAGSVASTFRLINAYQGTLVIDEGDISEGDTYNELVKILNSGFQSGIPVTRAGDKTKNFDVDAFEVFGPKIIGARFHFKDDALESRILTEDMSFITMRDGVETNTGKEFHEEMLTLRNDLLLYRFRNKGKKTIDKDLLDKSIEPRLRQIALPLMSIVEDPDHLKALQDYIIAYDRVVKGNRAHALTYQIAEIICELIEGGKVPTMQAIADEYNKSGNHRSNKDPRSIGHIVRKFLGLQTEKASVGYIVSEESYPKLAMIAQKHGFGMHFVNVMNVDKGDKE